MGFIRNSIHVYLALGRPILALEVDSKIFDEVLKPLLDAERDYCRACLQP